MSLVNQFLQVFGLAARPTPPVSAFHAPVFPTPRPVAKPQARPALGVMLRREEILDKQGRLAGYRFSCDRAHSGQAVSPQQFFEALACAQVRQLAERRLVVIEINWADGDCQDWAALGSRHTVFHVQLPPVQAMPSECMDTLTKLRAGGFGVAISQPENEDFTASTPSVATHCFVDFLSMSIEQFEHLMARLRKARPDLCVAIENVPTWPERRLCLALGAELTMGNFLTTRDEQAHGEKLTNSRLVLLEMLNLIRNDGDTDALAAVAKRDPAIALHLLSLANSASMARAQKTIGIDQAITVLGREALYRWLAISVFRLGADQALDKALLEVALSRARLLELTALSMGTKQQADELFLVGLLSLIDTLLGVPMAEVLGKMTLPTAVGDVLIRNEGPYADYLWLALAIEKCRTRQVQQLVETLGLNPQDIMQCRQDALLWAEDAAS